MSTESLTSSVGGIVPATRRHASQVGLRARITVTFTLGSLAISLLIALSTLGLTRRALLQDAELRASERTQRNAEFVSNQLSTREQTEDLTLLISSVQTPATPIIWLRPTSALEEPAAWVRDGSIKIDDIPSSLRNRVMWSYTPALIRTTIKGEPQLIVGVPIASPAGSYFEVDSLAGISETVRTLTIVLAVCGSLTTLAGAMLGWWAARRALRPLALIGEAARKIADGRLETRLNAADYAEDAELGPLVSSFNEMVAALQERIDQDARFASDVSHELRSPLTTLTASVSVLRNAEDDLPKRARKALDLLETDVKRFSQLVEDLLEISRYDAGAVRLEMDETVLSEQVRSFLSRSSAAKSTLKVSSQLEGRVVTCDSRRVIRILANFVENADKYAGGVVAVTIEKEGEHVLIGVEDAGPGVPVDEQQRIFSRFSRGVHGGARGSDTGSGLGLALAQEHARLHGGSVWVEARENGENGSRFVVSLPLLEGDGDGEFVDQQDLPSLANAEQSPTDIDAHDGEWDTDERSEDRPNDPDGDDATGSEPTSPITAATDSDPNVSPHSSSRNGAPESAQTPPAPLDSDPTGTIEHAQ